MTYREEYMAQYPERVQVFKNDVDVGWYKTIESGVNSIKSTCEVHSFNIEEYELRTFDGEVVWRGIDEK